VATEIPVSLRALFAVLLFSQQNVYITRQLLLHCSTHGHPWPGRLLPRLKAPVVASGCLFLVVP